MGNINLIANMISGIGIAMLIVSIMLYVKRTGDKSAFTKFWASKSVLTKAEMMINRAGLFLAVVGIMLPIIIRKMA
jgi:hypothetical protein